MNWAIDVSGYDGRRWLWNKGFVYDQPMDWKKARDEDGIRLAIMKSSEGTVEDRAFRMNWSGARGVLPRMAYHFFRSNINAIQQAKYMIGLLRSDFDPRTDYIILDFETMDGKDRSDCLRAAGSFLYEIENEGILPMIYTYPSFWRGVGGEQAIWAKRYPLGLAQWPLDNWIANTRIQLPPYLFTADKLAELKAKVETGALKPVALKPWDSPAIWQFTARADAKAIPGHPAIKKVVDYNVVYMPLPVLPGELPGIPLPPAPPPVDPENNWFKVDAALLKVFAGPGGNFRQVALPLRFSTVVVVLETRVEAGETWARIKQPVGWVRASWLTKL